MSPARVMGNAAVVVTTEVVMVVTVVTVVEWPSSGIIVADSVHQT